jgi:hypothetical protein
MAPRQLGLVDRNYQTLEDTCAPTDYVFAKAALARLAFCDPIVSCIFSF